MKPINDQGQALIQIKKLELTKALSRLVEKRKSLESSNLTLEFLKEDMPRIRNLANTFNPIFSWATSGLDPKISGTAMDLENQTIRMDIGKKLETIHWSLYDPLAESELSKFQQEIIVVLNQLENSQLDSP